MQPRSRRTPPPRPDSAPALVHDSTRALTIALLVIGALTLLFHALGATLLRNRWWGVHSYAFLPAWVLPPAAVAAAIAVWWFLRGGWGAGRAPGPAPAGGAGRTPGPAAAIPLRLCIALAAAFMLIAWLARVRHLFLGDATPLTQELPRGTLFHPRQPLTYLLQHYLFTGLGSLFSGPGVVSVRVAAMTTAVGSVVSGGLFALIACALGSEALGGAGGRRAPDRTLALLAAGLFLVQGFDLLFFGYVENYTFYSVALAFYLLSAVRYLRGRWGLWVPIAAAGLATALHLSGAVLLPSLLFLVGCAPGLKTERRRLVLDLAVGIAVVIGFSLLLRRFGPGYGWLSTIWNVGWGAVHGSGGTGPGYMFSGVHFRDFLNGQWLIGPLALFFFLAAVIAALAGRQRWNRERIFLVVIGASSFLACWVAGDSNLGYARNWDLLAPNGIVFLAGGLFLFCAAPAGIAGVGSQPAGGPPTGRARARGLLAAALVISLFQFLPWVAINISERLGVARVSALPLGGGRSEVMLGSWHLGQGRLAEAREWYHRAIEAYPGSHVAHASLGTISLMEKKYGEAADEYLQAARLKGDWTPYQENAVNALILAGRFDEALRELPILLDRSPRNTTAWIQYCQLLFQSGRTAEALRAIDTALELEPGNARAAAIRNEIRSASSPDSTGR